MVLIVGAGPVGLTLATELRRRQIPFDIIDKAAGPAPMHESRALAINTRTQTILEPSDITRRIIDVGHQINTVNICWHGHIRNSVALNAGNQVTGKLIVCPQGKIERLLIDQLGENNIHVRWNTALKDYAERDGHIEATVLDCDGVLSQVSACYVVGCDGAHSSVRKLGAYTFDGETDEQVWTLVDASIQDDRFKHTLTADLRPGKAFATIPIGNKLVRLIHNGPNLLDNHPFGELCTKIHWSSDFKVSYRLVKQFNRGRTFLCGDAAHIHSPVGGRGMNLGIEDAATLAYLLEHNRENEFSAMRLPVAKKVLKMTHEQTRQMNSASWLSSRLKQYGPKLINVPAVRQNLLRGLYGLDTPKPAWITA